jgi:hypothetical protein
MKVGCAGYYEVLPGLGCRRPPSIQSICVIKAKLPTWADPLGMSKDTSEQQSSPTMSMGSRLRRFTNKVCEHVTKFKYVAQARGNIDQYWECAKLLSQGRRETLKERYSRYIPALSRKKDDRHSRRSLILYSVLLPSMA